MVPQLKRSLSRYGLGMAGLLACTSFVMQSASAHPHVFAESRLEIETSKSGEIIEFRHVWRFDEFFSSSVVLDFDENGNLELDKEELITIGNIVRESLADYGYYTNVTVDGTDFEISPPDIIHADFADGQLLLFFAMRPHLPLFLDGKISAGVYDPTMYAAMDFLRDEDLVITGAGKDICQRQVVRPDPDEVIEQNQGSLTEAFYDENDVPDFSKLFATRLELTC